MKEEKNNIVENKKNSLLTIMIILTCLVIIGTCIYFIYDNVKVDNSNKENNSKIENKVDKDKNIDESKKEEHELNEIEKNILKADTDRTIKEILLENGFISNNDTLLKEFNVILDYGIIKNKIVKIEISTTQTNYQLIVYVDSNKYVLFNSSSSTAVTTLNYLLKYLKIESNNIGILFINDVAYGTEYSLNPFLLIYNNQHDFEYISNIITGYSENNWNIDNRNNSKIVVDKDKLYYYVYNEEKAEANYCIGKTDIEYIKYDGITKETVKQYNDVFIHEIYC